MSPELLTLWTNFSTWLGNNYDWVISLLVAGILVPFAIYWLSRKKTDRQLLQHRESIQRKLDEFAGHIRNDRYASEVRLIDTKQYRKHYPTGAPGKTKVVDLRAEFKTCYSDGVEFFSDMPQGAVESENGKIKLVRGTEHEFVVSPVGKVPYEWVDFVELEGDEYHNFPLIYCRFKGKGKLKGTPYNELKYYFREEGSDYLQEVEVE